MQHHPEPARRSDPRPGVRDERRHGDDGAQDARMRAARSGSAAPGARRSSRRSRRSYLTATDPVCGMSVDRTTAQHMLKHEGTRYYFCCEGCQKKFEAEPAKYLNATPFVLPPKAGGWAAPSTASAAPSPVFDRGGPSAPSCPSRPCSRSRAAGGAKWTCPMHPEIVKDGPGDCPICGMALEPMVASLDDGPNPELVDFTRRLWVSALLQRAAAGAGDGRHGRVAGCAARIGETAVALDRSWCWQRRWCCGRRGRSSGGSGTRWSTARPTCGR